MHLQFRLMITRRRPTRIISDLVKYNMRHVVDEVLGQCNGFGQHRVKMFACSTVDFSRDLFGSSYFLSMEE
jgi:hypothetical protein